MNSAYQLGLFPGDQGSGLNSEASLQAAIGAFPMYMDEEDFTTNTRKAFLSDLRLLAGYLGIGQPVGAIGTKDLNDFLNWLVHERGVPCSRKSYARRVTTLKVFFGWLYSKEVINADPSTDLIQITVSSPLPKLPREDDIDAALKVSSELMLDDPEHSDTRPHLLLTLLLETGIKKSEAMGIVPNHIDRDDPDSPFLFIRYKNPKYRFKERKLPLQKEWLDILDLYLEQYQPTDTLFTCTARNLEYVLDSIGEEAGLPKGLLSFENLRWYSALRDFQKGVDHNSLRNSLGLERGSWRTTKKKLEQLVAQQSPDLDYHDIG